MFDSIKTKIAFSQVTLLLIGVLIISSVSYLLMKRAIKEQLGERLSLSAATVAHETAANLTQRTELLKQVSQGRALESYRTNFNDLLLRQYLSGFRDHFPVLSYVGEQGLEEERLIHRRPVEELRNVGDTELFLDAVWTPGQVIQSEVEVSPDLGEPVVKFMVARKAYFGDFEGILLGSVPLHEIVLPVSSAQIGEGGFAILIDDKARVLSHPNETLILRPIEGDPETINKILSEADTPQKMEPIRVNLGGGRWHGRLVRCCGYELDGFGDYALSRIHGCTHRIAEYISCAGAHSFCYGNHGSVNDFRGDR